MTGASRTDVCTSLVLCEPRQHSSSGSKLTLCKGKQASELDDLGQPAHSKVAPNHTTQLSLCAKIGFVTLACLCLLRSSLSRTGLSPRIWPQQAQPFRCELGISGSMRVDGREAIARAAARESRTMRLAFLEGAIIHRDCARRRRRRKFNSRRHSRWQVRRFCAPALSLCRLLEQFGLLRAQAQARSDKTQQTLTHTVVG